MLKLALCDDRRRDLDEIQALLAAYRQSRRALELTVFSYSSASALLDAGIDFDLYLLDILMPGLNGIELGQELRRKDSAAPIVYLTTSRDFALESYRAKAMSYLLKPVGQTEFFDAMDHAVERCKLALARAFPVTVSGGIRRVFYHELVWAEASGRSIEYHLPRGLVISSTRQRSFAELWSLLRTDGRFLLARRGCLVNMDHVDLMGEAIVELSSGQLIPIPRQRRQAVRRVYLDYCRSWATAAEGAG